MRTVEEAMSLMLITVKRNLQIRMTEDGSWLMAAETFDSDQMTTKETPICY